MNKNLMINNLRLDQDGFTLVEIIITIVLVSIIAIIAALIILQGVRAYSGERSRSDVHYQARLAMERMEREIRLIRNQGTSNIPIMVNNNLQFVDVNGATVNFSWVGTTLSRGADALAQNITAFTFNYYQQDGVTTAATADVLWYVDITMTDTQGSNALQLRTTVHPRNF